MDIAAMSMSLSSLNIQSSVGVSVAKKAMDQQQIVAQGLQEMIETAMPPSEHLIDVKA